MVLGIRGLRRSETGCGWQGQLDPLSPNLPSPQKNRVASNRPSSLLTENFRPAVTASRGMRGLNVDSYGLRVAVAWWIDLGFGLETLLRMIQRLRGSSVPYICGREYSHISVRWDSGE
ncbi:hypothetical protein AVEN_178572-1 [Araneus ventricosus]|uniref:Uncharacterized protein n=1 Tax=Araneus ventricosus TaxID=182803 RepID=A0A4Y2FGP2_ARAVE|nr:hypothetical protein AVEN_178572-1 [Araneus ventricosus]